MRKDKYAVISPAVDMHIAYVERHLDEPFVVLDWSKIPSKHLPVSYGLKKNRIELVWDGRQLDRIQGVWYRKPYDVSPESLRLEPKKAAYAATALTQFNNLLLTHFADAFWVSDYYAVRKASNKTLQLQLARSLGFAVPDTLITSSPSAAKAFVERQQTVIVKPINVQLYRQDGKDRIFLAQRVNKDTIDYGGLNMAPAIFQQEIDVDVDVRVTVVGNEIFAATITGSALSSAGSSVRDWRIVHHEGNMVVTAFDLPERIADLCVAHVKELGLAFGAIDLVRDTKGKYWFLENNPNGQWLFVELATGQQIGKAVASLLMGKTSRSHKH